MQAEQKGQAGKTRSRETAGRAVNARWGVNSELRTPFTPPTTRDAILGGENICSAGAVGEAASFPRGQSAACSFYSPNRLSWPQYLLLTSFSLKSFCS